MPEVVRAHRQHDVGGHTRFRAGAQELLHEEICLLGFAAAALAVQKISSN